jgi:hypothetical protein
VAPWVFLAASVWLVVVVVRKLRAPAAAPAAEAPAATVSDDEAERIDDELRKMD